MRRLAIAPRAAAVSCLLVAACGAPPAAPAQPAPQRQSPSPAPTPAAAPPTANAEASSTAPPTPPPAEPQPVLVSHLSWSHELELDGQRVALGKKRVAVLERVSGKNAVRMRDLKPKATWQELPLPERLRAKAAEEQTLDVFFGRDDRPRLMGWKRTTEGTRVPSYFRYRQGWKNRTGEIGRLDGGTGALFGVLGHDDPEIVCKEGDICIIKRLTGWTEVPVPPDTEATAIGGGSAFAYSRTSLLRIDKGHQKGAAWKVVSSQAPWSKTPNGMCSLPDGNSMWFAAGATLHYYDGAAFESQKSPISGARACWARAADDVFLVGEGGAAHFDGKSWRRLEEPKGELRDVKATTSEVFACGKSGVWVGR